MTLEPERDNPNDIRTKLAQHVQVAHKMAALSSDWSAPYASSNAEYNILRKKFFVRGDTEHALNCSKQGLLGSKIRADRGSGVFWVVLPHRRSLLEHFYWICFRGG